LVLENGDAIVGRLKLVPHGALRVGDERSSVVGFED